MMTIDSIQQNRAEEDLLTLDFSEFQSLVEPLLDGCFILGNQGEILSFNASAATILCKSPSELLGSVPDIDLPDTGTAHVNMSRQDAAQRHILVSVQKARWRGQLARVVVLTDMTERKATDEALESAWKIQMRMKDEVLSRVSHELRSPLNAVYQYVTILLDGLAGDINTEQRDYLGIALRNVNQLRNMIGELLDVTRSQSNKLHLSPCEMDVAETVNAAVETVQHEALGKKQSLLIEVPDGLPMAYADPQRVQQVIVNLLNNAIKFTPEGGAITLCARAADLPPDGAPPSNARLEMTVTDSGCGIAEEDHERIFQHLYQVRKTIDQKRGGLGLGLFICRDLVSRLGGKIWVESCVGQGSTFHFTLPVFSLELAVLTLVNNHLAEAKKHGVFFSLVVVDTDSDENTILPAWEKLHAAFKGKAKGAIYSGKRFAVCLDADGTDSEAIREQVRRLAKKACFSVAPKLSSTLFYGVASAGPDTESAETLLRQVASGSVSEKTILAQKSVVVVDDEESYLRLLTRYLAALGVRNVRTATSGTGLFALLEAEGADLIVLDLQMQGMNGHEVIGRLKENPKTSRVPVVIVSGSVMDTKIDMSMESDPEVPALSKLNMSEVQRWVRYLL